MDPFGRKVILYHVSWVRAARAAVRHASAAEVFRRDLGNDVIFLLLNGMLTKAGRFCGTRTGRGASYFVAQGIEELL